MKLKMTIIAFFASVLVLTSCMKNEVSPGIEQVRTAYAALLNAKAQAEIIIANADAALTNAKAQMELADAAYRQAQAEGVEAQTATALAALAHQIEMYAFTIAAQELAQQKAMDAYAAALQAANDSVAALYFDNYNDALQAVMGIQDSILRTHKHILDLELDIANGTTNAMADLQADLTAAQAKLAAMQAELAEAKTLLGDVDAVATKLAQYYQDSVLLVHDTANLKIAMKQTEPDWEAENKAYLKAVSTESSKHSTYLTKKSAYDNFEANFLKDTMPYDSIPKFWGDALAAVAYADSVLEARKDDTLASYTAMTDAQDIIAAGTTAIDARIADTIQAISDYNDSITKYVNDSLAAYAAYAADSTAYADLKADTAEWNAEILVLADSAAAQRARAIADGTPGNADSLLLAQSVADSNLLAAQVTYAHLVTLPALSAAAGVTLGEWNAAKTATDNAKAFFQPLISTAQGILGSSTTPTGLYLTRANTLQDIANATAALPDLISDYLYWQTFIPDLVEALNKALADKEAVRPDYETWKAEYYEAKLAVALKAKNDAYDIWQDAVDALADAADALEAAQEEYLDLMDQFDAAVTELELIAEFKALYEDVDVINQAFLDAFETAVNNAYDAIYHPTTGLLKQIADEEQMYLDGKVDYDVFQKQLEELEAKLAAAQAQAAYWKALLDEAIANGN